MEQSKDLSITCIGCGKEFIFTEGEQEFFKTRGLFTPKRCPACRKVKKEAQMREEASKGV